MRIHQYFYRYKLCNVNIFAPYRIGQSYVWLFLCFFGFTNGGIKVYLETLSEESSTDNRRASRLLVGEGIFGDKNP